MVLIAFSSHTIYHMMNKKFDLPFMDLHSLFQNSKYELLAFKGSMINQLLQKKIGKYVMNSRNAARVFYTSSTFELYNEICFSKKKRLAIFEAEDHHETMGKLFCQLVPTKKSYFISSIASGVKRGYRYKRSFDIGIMKLAETGLISAIRTRWINWKVVGNNDMPFQSIDISQVTKNVNLVQN
ncbi:PREDICTED: uncharacterized protein LOC105363293 [Ceratosolen solmsi marchali]|uniref:Uncharacterized protein LOC105363293 n=1 Tax=Ceratosolen solmsi marchali TaxID=326594 RepID=A0AAJ7DWS8_9HYME|nr:PREDICTED: uncharacterized protein LOC105363293 [Ceratosolen solmsi marchali]